jgi:hypothetical protein
MRTHPVVLIGGILHENPYYVPPDVFLRERRERRTQRANQGRETTLNGGWRRTGSR